MKNITLSAGVSTDKGHVRANNEDNIFFDGFYLTEHNRDDALNHTAEPKGDFAVYAVFDGMGGVDYGEEASYIAAETAAKLYSDFGEGDELNLADEFVIELVKKSNEAICKKAGELGASLMGSTMALVVVYKNKAKFYNVGDSRIYLQRNNNIIQMSIDDSFAQRLHQLGVISREEAAKHKDRNKLIQYLGVNTQATNIDIHMSDEIELIHGDKILICSDGLSEMVSNKKINEIVSKEISVGDKCEELICEALNLGGRDNISVVLIEANQSEETQSREAPARSTGTLVLFSTAILIAIAICLFGFLFLGYTVKDLNTNYVPAISQNADKETDVTKEKAYDEYVNTVYIIPGETFDLSAIITAAEIEKGAVFSSGHSSVADVDSNGILTAKAVGKTAVVIEDSKKIYTINIEVLEGGVSRGKVPVSERLTDIIHKLSEND